MKDIFKRVTNSIICSSILALIMGLVLIIFPTMSLRTIGLIIAVYVILYGLVLIVIDVKASKCYIPFDGMLPGILSIIIGIILIFKPKIISTLFAIIIGVWIIVSSINSIKLALNLRDENIPWILLLILGIVDLILGVIVIFNPFEALQSLTIFVGVMIMVHAIIDIIDMLILKHDVKKISKVIENKIKDIRI